MKNPKTNPAIEAIKARLKFEYCPDGNIPNSHVAKKMDLIDATATLEYTKTLKRTVRKAMEGECGFTKELQQKKSEESEGYIDAITAAYELEVTVTTIRQLKKEGKLNSVIRNNKIHFLKHEIEAFRRSNGPFYLS